LVKTESGVRARSDNPRSRGPAPDFRRDQLPPRKKRRPRPARHRQHFMDPRWTQSMQTFVARQPVNQAGRPAHADHIRTTSIPSNYDTFTNHLHISRQSDRRDRAGSAPRLTIAFAREGEPGAPPPGRSLRHKSDRPAPVARTIATRDKRAPARSSESVSEGIHHRTRPTAGPNWTSPSADAAVRFSFAVCAHSSHKGGLYARRCTVPRRHRRPWPLGQFASRCSVPRS
jgi:hypothetical protein